MIWVLCCEIRNFRGSNGKSLTFNISKTTRILKCIKEQNLLRILFLTLCTFFLLNDPIREIWGEPLNFHLKYLESDEEFLMTCWTKNAWNRKIVLLISMQKGLAIQIRSQMESKVIWIYHLNDQYFVTSQRSRIIPIVDLNLIMSLLRSCVT